jgi:hypothetical protein
MPDYILNKNQINIIHNNLINNTQDINSLWESTKLEDREFILEYLKYFYPEKAKLIKEAKWYNTVGDILGIFDPTGVVDMVNGVSYFSQGDYFFGLLSMISVIPYFGDAIAKPIMGLGKGSKLMKGMNKALDLAKQGKTLEAGLILEKASKQSPIFSKLVSTSLKWGPKLKSAVMSIPVIPKSFKRMISDWIDLFLSGAKKSTQARRVVGNYNFVSKVALSSKDDAVKLISNMKKMVSSNTKVFRNFKFKDPTFMSKYFWPGFTIGKLRRNRDMVALLRKTKFWAGFLDYIGIGNFVGPEEIPDTEEMNNKFQEYVNGEDSKKNWVQDVSLIDDQEESAPQTTNNNGSEQKGGGIVDDILKSIFLGPLKPMAK